MNRGVQCNGANEGREGEPPKSAAEWKMGFLGKAPAEMRTHLLYNRDTVLGILKAKQENKTRTNSE